MKPDNVASFKYNGTPITLRTFGETDHISRIILKGGEFYELDLLKKVQEIYIPGTAIVDVGANIGNHTVFFAKILGAPVFAFEPNASAFEILTENISANRIDGLVTPHQIGVGAQHGRGSTVLPSATNMGQAQIVEAVDGPIAVAPLDFLTIPTPVGLIKIDVEGSECAVLHGARNLLRQHQPDVLVEAATTDQFNSVLAIMVPLGFVPRGRFAWTPTYLFSHCEQRKRFQKLLRDLDKPAGGKQILNFLRRMGMRLRRST